MATENIGLFDFPDGGKGLIYFGKNGFVAEILQNQIEVIHLENPPKSPKRALEKITYWYFIYKK